MQLVIEIPKEFDQDFKSDKFKEFFERSLADMHCVCGTYEREIAEMFISAFQNAGWLSGDINPEVAKNEGKETYRNGKATHKREQGSSRA